ncbi:MAG: TetR/AcrR family transcriptional regulator [Polyangiales bacterium]
MASRKKPGRKPTKTRERLSIEARRAQLLGLAIRAFSEHAFDEISTEAIAAEAGISHGLLFHYFPTKRALYVAALRVAADQLLRETLTQSEAPPHERLLQGLDAYFRFVEEHARAYATLIRGVGSDPVATQLVEATRAEFIENIRGHFAPLTAVAADPGEIRAALRGWIGLVEALSLDWIEHRDVPRDARIALAVRGLVAVFPAAADALVLR